MITINAREGVILNVDESRFNDEVRLGIFTRGLREILQNACAGAAKEAGEHASENKIRDVALAMSAKKLEAMYNGEFRTQSGERAPADPVRAEAFKLAWAAVKAALRKASKLPADKDAAREAIKAACTDEVVDKFMTQARSIVAIKSDTTEIDLTDLV